MSQPSSEQTFVLSAKNFSSNSRPSEIQSKISPTDELSRYRNAVILGTDLIVGDCCDEFTNFIKKSRFTVADAEIDEIEFSVEEKSARSTPLYMTKLKHILSCPDKPYLTINCAHLKEHNPKLFRQLVHYPAHAITLFDVAANELLRGIDPEKAACIIVSVRPIRREMTHTISSLSNNALDELVTIEGLVMRTSNIIPMLVKAFVKCCSCSHTQEVMVENRRIHEPNYCKECKSKFSFQLIHSRSKFTEQQMIKLQEMQRDVSRYSTPLCITVIADSSLIDEVNPGDFISLTGIYTATGVRVGAKSKRLTAVFKPYIDVLCYNTIISANPTVNIAFAPARVDTIIAKSRDPNIFEWISRHLFTSILGHEDTKKGIILQLFGGTPKKLPADQPYKNLRPDIHILLCGDPGTAKSKILKYVQQTMPKNVYIVGKGTTAVGLTASVVKDPDQGGRLTLSPGALVLSDGAICCIDEFDKMNDSTRNSLHEAMEQQTLSFAKCGIQCQLSARTSVLAACNPVKSDWDMHKTVVENINLPGDIISRFDLIYLIVDPQSEVYDSIIAERLVSFYTGEVDSIDEEERGLVKDYIAYARENVRPLMTDESSSLLIDTYVIMRRNNLRGHVNIYPRNLESLIRLSEAHAKARLSPLVETQDAEEAIRIFKSARRYNQTDRMTGRLDHQLIPED